MIKKILVISLLVSMWWFFNCQGNKLSRPTIHPWVQNASAIFVETQEGQLVICNITETTTFSDIKKRIRESGEFTDYPFQLIALWTNLSVLYLLTKRTPVLDKQLVKEIMSFYNTDTFKLEPINRNFINQKLSVNI
jgi:hypothetical protein